jgi:hypothetical protein
VSTERVAGMVPKLEGASCGRLACPDACVLESTRRSMAARRGNGPRDWCVGCRTPGTIRTVRGDTFLRDILDKNFQASMRSGDWQPSSSPFGPGVAAGRVIGEPVRTLTVRAFDRTRARMSSSAAEITFRARLLRAGIIGSMVRFARAPAWCGPFLLAVPCSAVPYWVRPEAHR